MVDDAIAGKAAKKKEEERQRLMQSLFAGLTTIKKKDEEGNGKYIYRVFTYCFLAIDPKFVICPLFKAGLCSKGRKCKNSHDLTVEQ